MLDKRLNVISQHRSNIVKDGAGQYRDIFAKVMTTGKKTDLSKGNWNLKRNMWVTTHFLEIIKQP